MGGDERLEAYARLAIEVGANVGAGQDVWLLAYPEHAPLVRAMARAAYARGARYVAIDYRDQHVRRAQIQLAPEETLDWTPPWFLALAEHFHVNGGCGDPDHGRSRARAARRPRRTAGAKARTRA